MSPNTHDGLKDYYKYLSRKTQPFCCIYCGIFVLCKDYENHCSRLHELESNSRCVWCCGTKSWESGEKHRHVDHLTACFDQFYDSRQVFPFTYPRPIDSSPTCTEVESFFDHSTSIRELLPPRVFQSIWPPEDLPTPPMTFQNENLNLAASYLQLYLETRDTHDWMHVMVKAVAMESFLQALDFDDGDTRVLDYWCWCDGGRDTVDSLRQHRHMIVISKPPKGRFEQEIWPLVRAQALPRPNFPSKRIKKIASPLHLVNTLGYLSKRRSRCNFSRTLDSPHNNHFYIFKTLPKGYKLPLSMLWPGGLLELLCWEKFQNVSIPHVIDNPLIRNTRHQWQQKIKYFMNLKRGLVIPVEKRFAPTTEITLNFLYLKQDHKLYFQSNPENETLNQAAWLQMQFEGGNSFYNAVGEETWTPCPRDQIRINDMMMLVKRIEGIESEKEELRMEKNELSEEYQELGNARVELIMECEKLENEISKLSEENKELKNEINKLSEENKTLKRKWEEEREKCRELSFKLNIAYEKEIVRLETENGKFRRLAKQCPNCQMKLQD